MQGIEKFNLRVYGILINDKCVLVTDENRGGVEMTKFPGGGLEKGEGLAECLIREFQEELEVAIQVGDFFYVNDFLQVSRFNPKDQLLSFYYRVHMTESELAKIPILKDKRKLVEGEQTFRWVSLTDLNVSEFTFPIDRVVCERLRR